MNGDLELKLQAYLDGELGGRESSRVEDWLEANGEAQGLLAELRMIKEAMAGAELNRSLPESGDFYWSKIQRGIALVERDVQHEVEPGWLVVLRRLLAPAAGVALVVLLTFVTVRTFTSEPEGAAIAVVETPSEEIGAYSFRSESQNMFVVWVYDRSPQGADEGSEATNDL